MTDNKTDQRLNLREKLELLPDQPGIYRFFSRVGKIIYIGKAKNLKLRVRSYFSETSLLDIRLVNLIPNIDDIEWVVTNTEAEALILEDQLIKTHRPKYNIQLKDDKSYPYFKVSLNEMFPRLSLVREIKKDGSLYFGPHVVVHKARTTMRIIKKYFPLRQSKMVLDGTKKYRPCLNYQLNKCLAPCAGLVTARKYNKLVDQVVQLLQGDHEELLESLRSEMDLLSENLKFEDAAKKRDQIRIVESTLQKQRVVSKQKIDRDVFSLMRSGSFAGIQVLFIRNGILLSDDFFLFKRADLYDDQELIRSILSRLYISGDKVLPREILLPINYDDATMIEDYCLTRRSTKVSVLSPQRGEKKALVALGLKNCELNLSLKMKEARADEVILKDVQKTLRLKNLPTRVECFDISNISGTNTVASMVVWQNNKALKSEYRKYKIKSVSGANDYAAMEEVLGRRFRVKADVERILPDLIIIDGGKGQIAGVERILLENGINLDELDLVGLAKGRSAKRKGPSRSDKDFEYVVKPHRKNIIPLKKNSSPLHFLQNIRDEAHRFAITYHRKLRGKAGIQSRLEEIPGIGPQKRKLLLKEFNTINAIKDADIDTLASVKGISKNDAVVVRQHLNQ
jgi:excinuclease ABC subunit C